MLSPKSVHGRSETHDPTRCLKKCRHQLTEDIEWKTVDSPISELQTQVDEEKALKEPYDYICQFKGKGFRSLFMKAVQHLAPVPDEALQDFEKVIKKLHQSSLLIDDIEDGSLLRRGQKATHEVYGLARTLNCANLVYFEAAQHLVKYRGAVQVYLDEMVQLHKGQGMDIYWRDTCTPPTIEQYLRMAGNKTGGLLRMCVRLMLTASPNVPSDTSTELVRLAEEIGQLFQIRDDYLNLADEEYMKTKGFATDVEEGAFSFLLTHAAHSTRHQEELLRILQARPSDAAPKQRVLQILTETDTFEFTRKFVLSLSDTILARIRRLGGNPQLKRLVRVLTESVCIPDDDSKSQ